MAIGGMVSLLPVVYLSVTQRIIMCIDRFQAISIGLYVYILKFCFMQNGRFDACQRIFKAMISSGNEINER